MEEKKWYDGYTQLHSPDKHSLSQIVLNQKGVYRTSAEYATAIDISPAMLSRIINGKYSKPFPMDILLKLSEGNDQTLVSLLRANGMVKSLNGSKSPDSLLDFTNAIYTYESVNGIILSDLVSKGFQIQSFPKASSNRRTPSFLNFVRIPFSLVVTAKFDENSEFKWSFLPFRYTLDRTEEHFSHCLQDIMKTCCTVFLKDAWEPQSLENQKISFVFCDQAYYGEFLELIPSVKLNNRMSAILINAKEHRVVEEQMLPSHFVQDGKCVLLGSSSNDIDAEDPDPELDFDDFNDF